MIERQNLIDFINKNGTEEDILKLVRKDDSQLRTIAQRLLSEQRTNENSIKGLNGIRLLY